VLVNCQKSMFLILALTLAKENMNRWTWKKCCEESVNVRNKAGVKQVKHFQTVTEWYKQFRVKRKFTMVRAKKHLQPLLDQNPEITTKIKRYCEENLGELSVEFFFEYLHNTITPKMVHSTLESREKALLLDPHKHFHRKLLAASPWFQI
jgi:hypothetical protein